MFRVSVVGCAPRGDVAVKPSCDSVVAATAVVTANSDASSVVMSRLGAMSCAVQVFRCARMLGLVGVDVLCKDVDVRCPRLSASVLCQLPWLVSNAQFDAAIEWERATAPGMTLCTSATGLDCEHAVV